MFRILAGCLAAAVVYIPSSRAQENARPGTGSVASQPTPIYRVTVVEHGIDAVNYQYRAAPTKIDFRGTVLLPDAKGEATVQSRRGHTEVEAKLENLVAPTRFGREYLTYVLWSISPEGTAQNLGEIIPDPSDRARLRVTTDMPAFGMIVTAEPYSTVRQPSNVVVMENRVRPDTVGQIRPIQPKPELLRQGEYTWDVQEQPPAAARAPKVSMNEYEALLQLYQAQNAVAIAQAANAEHYAPDALAAAQRALGEAQRLQTQKGKSKEVVQNAREAIQSAEDARSISERRKREEDASGASRSQPQADRSSQNQANRVVSESEYRARLRNRFTAPLLAE